MSTPGEDFERVSLTSALTLQNPLEPIGLHFGIADGVLYVSASKVLLNGVSVLAS